MVEIGLSPLLNPTWTVFQYFCFIFAGALNALGIQSLSGLGGPTNSTGMIFFGLGPMATSVDEKLKKGHCQAVLYENMMMPVLMVIAKCRNLMTNKL